MAERIREVLAQPHAQRTLRGQHVRGPEPRNRPNRQVLPALQ